MTLTGRKLLVLLLVGAVFLVANICIVANWLLGHGLVGLARNIRADYLTGTAVTIIVVLLILLARPRNAKPE